MLARNYRRCSTLQNATGPCRQGSGDRLSLCRGFTAGAPMSRRYPVEGAPGPSLLGTGEEVSTNSAHSYVLLGCSPKPQVALARRLNRPDMPRWICMKDSLKQHKSEIRSRANGDLSKTKLSHCKGSPHQASILFAQILFQPPQYKRKTSRTVLPIISPGCCTISVGQTPYSFGNGARR